MSSRFLSTGRLLVPGAAYCLLRRDGSIERHLLALGGLVFCAIALLTSCCFSRATSSCRWSAPCSAARARSMTPR